MSRSSFVESLRLLWAAGRFICVGLDPDVKRIPRDLRVDSRDPNVQVTFNRHIIRATADFVCAYKPNCAFYDAQGDSSFRTLRRTIELVRELAPGVPVIVDAKLGDIRSTNVHYAHEIFELLGADAVTVSPFFGKEALAPFLDRADKGIVVLVRTSNPGAPEFQDLYVQFEPRDQHVSTTAMPLYKYIALRVASEWNGNGNCCVVVGATAPSELAEVRASVGDMPILIPGLDDQGGSLYELLRCGATHAGDGVILNLSDAVNFTSDSAEAIPQSARSNILRYHEEGSAILDSLYGHKFEPGKQIPKAL